MLLQSLIFRTRATVKLAACYYVIDTFSFSHWSFFILCAKSTAEKKNNGTMPVKIFILNKLPFQHNIEMHQMKITNSMNIQGNDWNEIE